MTEDNQTPQPEWVAELKEWGIDVEVFAARWEQSGDEAKAQFEQSLAKATAAYEADQAELKAAVDEAREEVKEFVGKMNNAWDQMVSHIKQQVDAAMQENNSTDKNA